MEKIFNPYEWLPITSQQQGYRVIRESSCSTINETEIDEIVSRIENLRLDITRNYKDWLSIGFALVSELGEYGREYFHRVSRFHPDYNIYSCNIQFDKCIRSPKGGISIKTFFYLAKSAGINIRIK